MLGTLSILGYAWYNLNTMRDNASGAGNQQGSPLSVLYGYDPSETIRRAPFPKEEILAYLQGSLHDATLNKGNRFRFSQKDRRWLEILRFLFKKCGYNSWIYREGKNRNLYVLETTAGFLDFEFDFLADGSIERIKGYIRGFFDAEGGIPKKLTDRFYIQMTQKDKDKLEKIKIGLDKLDINRP